MATNNDNLKKHFGCPNEYKTYQLKRKVQSTYQ